MYISCKCLNVSITTRGNNELKDVKDGDIELSPAERADGFFNEKLVMVTDVEAITKEQSFLVEVRNVGSWNVNYCYNCTMYTHAVHREQGSDFVLVHANIAMSSAEVDKLRASPNYSTVFRIVIARNSLDDGDDLETPTKFSASQLSRPQQTALAALQQQLEEALQRESDETDEKVHALTIERYNILEKFRENAHEEHTRLARLICNHGETAMATTNVETSPNTTPDRVKDNSTTSIAQSVNSKSPAASPGVITGASIRHQAATKHPSHLKTNGGYQKRDKLQIFYQEPKSYDAEALFPLEGMEETFALEQIPPSEDESETEGEVHDEGIPIPKTMRSGHPTLTKSLPISIPAFRSPVRRTVQDQDDDEESRDPLDPHNIQASIKALAKSVHGDTVFGDLPQPRFSTQL